jgi:Spy/CpxP family protein refolding chaperone
MNRLLVAALVIAATSRIAVAAHTQQPQPAAPETPAVTPLELQRMFDAYALVQAQEQLKITDEQYAQFLPRFKVLQDVRRRALQDRARVVQELRRLLMDERADDMQIKDRLRTLGDIETRAENETRKAYDAIDQVLDVRQQAKFRIFEEQMERRKLELVTRARQANRLRARP